MSMLRCGRGIKSSVDSVISEVDGGNIGHVHDELHFHRVRWIFNLIHEFDDSEMTSSFSLLSKPILDLFQIQWAFH